MSKESDYIKYVISKKEPILNESLNDEAYEKFLNIYYDLKNNSIEDIKLVKENLVEASIEDGFIIRELIVKIEEDFYSINFVETYDGIELLEDDEYKSKLVKCFLVKKYK